MGIEIEDIISHAEAIRAIRGMEGDKTEDEMLDQFIYTFSKPEGTEPPYSCACKGRCIS